MVRMEWLIAGLLLVLGAGLAVLTHWYRRRPVADDSLIAELLGTAAAPVPPTPPAPPPTPPAPELRDPLVSAQRQPAGDHVSRPGGDAGPGGDRGAQPAADGDWLATQLAWIAAWSERMQEQFASAPAPRCTATTAKGSRCKLPARPGETTCAIHAGRAR